MKNMRKSLRFFAIFMVITAAFITAACGNDTTSGTTAQSAATPTATPAGGSYDTEQTVTLATATAGADIYYTLDESDPTAASTKYVNGIPVYKTTTLKAIAVKTGMTNSEILTETYTIASIDLPESGITPLKAETWSNGIIAAGGEQWFKFSATADTQYIHFEKGTLNDVYVQVYDDSGAAAGSRANLSGSNLSASLTLTNGGEYYIKVTASSGTATGGYKIAFNAALFPPDTIVTTLTATVWTNTIAATSGEKWFKFTATAETQYIHADLIGTNNSVNVQLYDSNDAAVGSNTLLSGSAAYTSQTLTEGDEYYIKTSPSASGTYRIMYNTSTVGITTLTANTWAASTIGEGEEQWFKFTATAATQYIHFAPGSMDNVNVQLYDSTITTSGNQELLYGSTLYFYRAITNNSVYYIKVTPFDSNGSGVYRIAFNAATTPPVSTLPNSGVITLTADTWADGTIAEGGEQWFNFVATAGTQYIHFEDGTLSSVYIQLYDSTGAIVGSRTNLYGTILYTSRTLTSNNIYYIKVMPYSGSGVYRIAFNTSTTPPKVTLPTTGVTTLNANVWSDGSIAEGGGQWFNFTATATTQYIHFEIGTLRSVYVQLYDSTGTTVDSRTNLYNYTSYTSRTVTSNNVYYIKVKPSSGSGAYRIAFSGTTSVTPPVTLPTTDVTQLTANTWANGNIATSGGEQWFKFTATAASQYIHFEKGTLNNVYVQLYDSTGSTTGSRGNLYNNILSMTRTLTNNNEYHIKVTPYSNSESGAYRIAFNAILIPPDGANVTTLSANVWANGSIGTGGGEQWFKFTATAATQYIHFEKGTLNDVNVQLYTSTGTTVGAKTNLYSSTLSINRPVTTNSVYYIQVTPYFSGYSGAYRIAFNATTGIPGEMTQFRFGDFSVDGTISGTNISVTVPNIVNLTTLAPTITHNGKSVSPASGVEQDFTTSKTYTVTAEDNSTKNYTVTVTVTNTGLAAAFSWINNYASSNRTYTIVARASESLAPVTINAYSTNNIILSGGTTEKTISLSSNGSLFTVSGGTLTLENNITLSGRTANDASLVRIDGGTLVMKTGSKIQNNTKTRDCGSSSNYSNSNGGGVYIDGGTFTMDGGTITGNKVEATNSSSSSYTNEIKAMGGGVYFAYGTFVMNGGTISNNTAYSNKYATAGGGVYVDDSETFTMNGGTISGNTAESSSVLATSNTYGGGVAVWDSGTFTMTGGTISGNTVKTASNCYGGGVYVRGTKFTKTGGTIYGNTESTTTLRNTAKNDASGHAVYVYISASSNYKRTNTAGTTVNLNSGTSGSGGGWE
jgi:hypothetical protein